MCGRFSINADSEQLTKRYNAHFEQKESYKRYNVAPSQYVPIIVNEDPSIFEMVKWGLKPKWMKTSLKGDGLINVRAETIREKPMFKKSFEERRCLIPSTGFYEWKKDAKGSKQPYLIKLKEEPIFSFAGVWSDNQDEDGNNVRQFAIITTAPNSLLAEIHNRMPVILPPETEGLWLSDGSDINELAELLSPFNETYMEALAVSTKINNPSYDAEDVINPL